MGRTVVRCCSLAFFFFYKRAIAADSVLFFFHSLLRLNMLFLAEMQVNLDGFGNSDWFTGILLDWVDS